MKKRERSIIIQAIRTTKRITKVTTTKTVKDMTTTIMIIPAIRTTMAMITRVSENSPFR